MQSLFRSNHIITAIYRTQQKKNEKDLFYILVVLIGSCGQPRERLFVSLNTFLFGHESCGDPVGILWLFRATTLVDKRSEDLPVCW